MIRLRQPDCALAQADAPFIRTGERWNISIISGKQVVVKAPIESLPWFLSSFLVVWAAAMAYVVAYLAMAVRYRKLTGLSQGAGDWITVFFDPATRGYFWWMFTSKHRELGDVRFSQHVYAVRGMFAVAATLMAAFFVAIFIPR
jgi:hypothetical protein